MQLLVSNIASGITMLIMFNLAWGKHLLQIFKAAFQMLQRRVGAKRKSWLIACLAMGLKVKVSSIFLLSGIFRLTNDQMNSKSYTQSVATPILW